MNKYKIKDEHKHLVSAQIRNDVKDKADWMLILDESCIEECKFVELEQLQLPDGGGFAVRRKDRKPFTPEQGKAMEQAINKFEEI